MKRGIALLWICGGIVIASAEPPLPEWDAEARARMLDKNWMPGGSLLTFEELPGEELAEVIPLILEEPSPEDLGEPEADEDNVAEEFLSAYFGDKPEHQLVDPQSLLKTEEVRDLKEVLDYHAGDSSIDMYVYVFGADQHIPGDVREEEVVERLYSEGKPALVVYYYLGDPQRAEIYLSPMITDAVSAAEQRRALKSSVVQALADVNSSDQLRAFLLQMSIRIYWMERMAEGTAAVTKEAIPDESFQDKIPDKVGVKVSPALPSWLRFAGAVAASVFGGLMLVWTLAMWLRSRARFHFPEYEIEPRLGGSHAAGIGAVISFSSSAVPPARQRDQVPDYLRRA